MRTVSIADRVESETQGCKLGFVVDENQENYDSFTYVEDMTDEELATIAKRYQTSPAFIQEISGQFQSLADAVHRDLADIWERLK